MKLKPKRTIADYFVDVEDPRIERTKEHKLIDIITIAIWVVLQKIVEDRKLPEKEVVYATTLKI